MPRPNRGKTETIKERAIYVYLPSHEMTKDWKDRAEKAGVSISKFVTDRVGDSIGRGGTRKAVQAGSNSSSD